MTEPSYRAGQPIVWHHRLASKSNQHCLYCGVLVGEGSSVESDKEHLIGRRFVPAGAMEGTAFNFIFRACRECNARKAAAERHISSVSLFTSPARGTDSHADAIARQKGARDFHPRRRGTLVQNAYETSEVRHQFGPATFRFNLAAPPQLIEDEVFLLASMQVQALFSLVTTLRPDDPAELRLLPLEQIIALGFFVASDWGNPQLIEVARRARPWQPRVQIVSARGFFRALVRRSDNDGEGWFWALEWNNSVRIAGAITLPGASSSLFDSLPSLGWSPLPDGTGRIRLETPLTPEQDTLFEWDDRLG